LLRADAPGALLKQINEQIRASRSFGPSDGADSPEAIRAHIDDLTRLVSAIAEAFQHPEQADEIFARIIEPPTTEPWLYLESPTGKLVFVLVSPLVEEGTINAEQRAIAATRRVIDEVRIRHPGVEVGLTGTAVVDSDETAVATVDSAVASSVSLILITVLLIIAFHSVRMPLIVLASLLVGVGWSFGYLTIAIGHLQVLSVVFIAVLLGLGVDFGIHLDSTYEHVRRRHPDGAQAFGPALAETLRLSAPGIVTGALTTAAAFLTTAFTDFKGVAEMGIIASGGVVLCLISMFTVFPALLRLFRHSHRHVRPLENRVLPIFREQWIRPISRRPGLTLVIALVGITIASIGAMRLDVVYDLLSLHPEGVESVEWQERVIRDGGASIYFGVSIADTLEEAFERQERFAELPDVSSVGGIGLCNPPDTSEKIMMQKEAGQALRPAMESALAAPPDRRASASTSELTTELAALQRMVAESTSRQDVPPLIMEGLVELRSVLDEAVSSYRAIEIPQRIERVERIDAAWVRMRRQLARELELLLDPSPLTPGDFPASFMRPFVDVSDPTDPRYCLHIYPELPDDPRITDPLSPLFLPAFVEDLVRVDPEVTGVVVQIQRSGELIWSSYRQAAITAMIVVLVLVWLVFRSLLDTLLAILPVVLGFLATFGVMGAIDLDLNPANLMILPLLFGIGVDAGVHVVHRYRLNPAQRPLGLTSGTGKGITLTSLTTMCGFATMMLARHRGVASLGMVMTIGLLMSTLVCWTVLPALLEVRQRRRERTETS
jgi:hopanoid biosynthesis associated RND transporter like protein HpnN